MQHLSDIQPSAYYSIKEHGYHEWILAKKKKKKTEGIELETKLSRFQEHFIITCGSDVFCTQYINNKIQIFLDDLQMKIQLFC
jgi:hypothetical protein